MICCEPCPQNRSPSGHSTPRSLCRHMPHTSTEFSPHFLLYGWKPQLPVDPCAWAHNHIRGWTHQLGTAASAAPAGFACRGTKTSPRNCSWETKADRPESCRSAEKRKQTDQKVADHPLHVGDLVYLRNHVLGSSKIHVWWCPAHHDSTSLPWHTCVWSQTILWWAREMTCCMPGHHWLLPQRNQHRKQAYPQYPDQGEFWLGWPVTIGVPSAAPIPAAPIPTAPVNSCCCTLSCSWHPPPPPPPPPPS